MPKFSGFVKYTFKLEKNKRKRLLVEFSGESCVVIINGKKHTASENFLICDLPDNQPIAVDIVLSNLLAYKYSDYFSKFNYIEGCYLSRVEVV